MTRPRDLLYDAWVETWGEPVTRTERGRLNAALKELRAVGATPEEVRRALRTYDTKFGVTRSPQGVTGNWSQLLNGSKPSAPKGETCPHGVSFFERCWRCEE